MNELTIPPAAARDEKSVEIVRAWIAEGAQWIVLNPNMYRGRDFEEEWAWGLFLADTVRHLSNAIAEQSGKNPLRVSEAIQKSLRAEMKKTTTAVKGGFVEDGAA